MSLQALLRGSQEGSCNGFAAFFFFFTVKNFGQSTANG